MPVKTGSKNLFIVFIFFKLWFSRELFYINKTFDNKINSYISGDVTIDKLKHFEFVKMPFSKTMIGTKYCYSSMIVEKLNCGFVYK